MAKCACEKTGKPVPVNAILIHGSVYLSERVRVLKDDELDPNIQCVIVNMLMAIGASAAELRTQPADIIPLNHVCRRCGYKLRGYIQPEIAKERDFTNQDADEWGSGWSKDN